MSVCARAHSARARARVYVCDSGAAAQRRVSVIDVYVRLPSASPPLLYSNTCVQVNKVHRYTIHEMHHTAHTGDRGAWRELQLPATSYELAAPEPKYPTYGFTG